MNPVRAPKSAADQVGSAVEQTTEAEKAIAAAVKQTTEQTAAAVERTAPAMERTAAASNEVARDAASKVESLVADTQKTMTEQIEKLSKGFEGFTAFGQENVDALVKSSEVAAKAAEGIASEITAYSKKAFEDGVAAAQELASAKTMTELFEKQTAFAQSAFEGFVSQTTKMNEIMVAAAKDVSAPVAARMTAATDKMKTFAL